MAFEVVLEEFSGPLDLLCALVESRSIAASRVRVADVVRLYSVYLSKKGAMTIRELAEFLSLAARLLLGKILAILPSLHGESEIAEEEPIDFEESIPEDIEAALARYRPYRAAASVLRTLFERRSACFSRPGDEEPPYYDLGDIYTLAALWWEKVAQAKAKAGIEEEDDYYEDNGIPEEVAEEDRVETRMGDIRALLTGKGGMRLDELLNGSMSRSLLVLTLLALLEMSRLGEVRLGQKELFGHVDITLV